MLEIRQGIADALRAIPGLNAQPYVLGNLSAPCAHVLRGPIAYDQSMQSGVHLATFMIRLYVPATTDIGSQVKLDEYVGPDGERSIMAAIEEDPTLGGIVMALHVTDVSAEADFAPERGGVFLSSEFTVNVWF